MFCYNEKLFAPYVQTSADNVLDLDMVYKNLKQKYFILGFINIYKNQPEWSYYYYSKYDKYFESIRSKGGDIIVSFGGADGNEIAVATEDEDIVYENYKSIIERYKLKWIDLDIEGDVLKVKNANKLRNNALKKIKEEYPELIISYTLPVTPHGLNKESLELLCDARDKGVKIDLVNIMCMDYGSYYAPDPDYNMGYYAKLCTIKTKENLDSIGLNNTNIGITVMIGKNDVKDEVFTTYDATYLLRWARKIDYVKLMSYWSLNRDNGKGEGKPCSCNWSSIRQEDFEFCKYFQSFNYYENLALNKEIKCSSMEDNDMERFNPKYAIDGDPETRWASKEFEKDEEWIEIDLLNEYFVDEVLINWEAAYAKKFNVYISKDGENYICIYSCKDNNRLYNRFQIKPILCRYIKVQCIEKATQYGFSIYEIEVYNK